MKTFRLLFAPQKDSKNAKVGLDANGKRAILAGELCMALPLPSFIMPSGEKFVDSKQERFLAIACDGTYNKATFFDDGSETIYAFADLTPATTEEREAAKVRFAAAREECFKMASMETSLLVQEAIQEVVKTCGGLGKDNAISYRREAGPEANEGRVLFEAMIAHVSSALPRESPAAEWISTSWQAACAAADFDNSGTISDDEAVFIWDNLLLTVSEMVTAKVEQLGLPPKLYYHELCLAMPEGVFEDGRASRSATPTSLQLAKYVDSEHVVFLDDGKERVQRVTKIERLTPAKKEQEVLRYTKAVAQARHPLAPPLDAASPDAP